MGSIAIPMWLKSLPFLWNRNIQADLNFFRVASPSAKTYYQGQLLSMGPSLISVSVRCRYEFG